MKKTITLALLVFSLLPALFAKKIVGRVVDVLGEPLPGVNIFVKNSNEGTQTDSNGAFVLNTKEEKAILEVSFIGFKTKEIKAESADDLKKITLYEGTELLQEVVVTGERSNKFSRKETAYVAKIPLKNIENSQVYSTVTNDLLISQSVTKFDEAIKNAVGVQSLWGSTGRSGDGAGYYSLRGFQVQPKLVNGLVGITNGGVNPSNIERIEVVKGPSATLFGNVVSTYGGLINLVTKKPYKGKGGSVSLIAGSYDLYKATVDLNTPLAFNENMVFRINAGLHQQNSWQDHGFLKSMFVSPAFSYKVNNRLTLNFNYDFYRARQTNSTMLFLSRYQANPIRNIAQLNLAYKKSFTSNDISLTNPSQNFRAEASYKITDSWESQTLFSGSHTASKGYYTYTMQVQNNLFGLYVQKSDAETTVFNFQQNFIGDTNIFGLRNKILVGVDFSMNRNEERSTGFASMNVFNLQGDLVPVPKEYGFPNLSLNEANVKEQLKNQLPSNADVRNNTLGIYASDVINITSKLSFLAAVRYDLYDYKGDRNTNSDDKTEYRKATFSPKFGVVYKAIIDKLSFFANYQNGFSYIKPELVPVDPKNPKSELTLKTFDLEQANQVEVGVKTNLFENKLEATLSYYNITVKDKVLGYGATALQAGKVRSQGVELELIANPFAGLNLRGGVAYNDSEFLKHKLDKRLAGKRLAESGAPLSYNFWADYRFQNTYLKNLGFGLGFDGVNDYNTMVEYPDSGDFILPASTVFASSIYYDNNRFRLSLKVNNLLNEEYYRGWSTITPQSPRSFVGTFTYKF